MTAYLHTTVELTHGLLQYVIRTPDLAGGGVGIVLSEGQNPEEDAGSDQKAM